MAAGDVDVKITKTRAFNCNMFDGVDDYIDISHSDQEFGANMQNGMTISCWIYAKTLGLSNLGKIVDKSNSATGGLGFYLGLAATNRFIFRINGGTTPGSANNSLNFGIWTHILVTVNYNLVNFYINGVLNGTADQDATTNITSIATTNAMRIGNQAAQTSRTFDGGICQFKMWNKVLSQTEITAEYTGEKMDSLKTNLLRYFKLGGDNTDYGIIGSNLTNSGSLVRVVDSNFAQVLKAQRAATGTTYQTPIVFNINDNVVSAVIDE